jgi:hypothetical protein
MSQPSLGESPCTSSEDHPTDKEAHQPEGTQLTKETISEDRKNYRTIKILLSARIILTTANEPLPPLLL